MPTNIIEANIIQGPAIVEQTGPLGARFWFSKGPINLNLKTDTFDVGDAIHGDKLQSRMKGRSMTLDFTPASVLALFVPITLCTRVTAIAAAGTTYVVGETLTVTGGTGTAATIKVLAVGTNGAVTAAKILTRGCYSVAPTNPVAATGSTAGTNATFTLRLEQVSQWFPYCASDIGTDLAKVGSTIKVYSKAEEKAYLFNRSVMTKVAAGLRLKPSEEMLGGSVEFAVLGAATGQPWDEKHWGEVLDAQFPEPVFDLEDILTDVFQAEFDSQDIISNDGFEITAAIETKNIEDTNRGSIAAIALASMTAAVKCAPSNLTEAQLETLLRLQDTGALMPGQPISELGKDLVLTGANSGAVFTLFNAGAKEAQRTFDTGAHRFKQLDFVSEREFVAGEPTPLFTFDVE